MYPRTPRPRRVWISRWSSLRTCWTHHTHSIIILKLNRFIFHIRGVYFSELIMICNSKKLKWDIKRQVFSFFLILKFLSKIHLFTPIRRKKHPKLFLPLRANLHNIIKLICIVTAKCNFKDIEANLKLHQDAIKQKNPLNVCALKPQVPARARN